MTGNTWYDILTSANVMGLLMAIAVGIWILIYQRDSRRTKSHRKR